MARSSRRRYAKGRHALAECQRSGQKMRYRDLVEDGHIPGLLVHPDWWEPKHPQEIPPNMDDPVALWRPAPEISKPPGEGDDPRTGCCNLDPSIPANTTTAGAVPQGATSVGINDALRFDDARGRDTFVFIQMDNGDWYCSPIVVPIRCTPTYTINLSYPFDGPSTISAGNKVVAGNDSNFVLAAAAVPASLNYQGGADAETAAIQINAVGGCPPYLYQWEWVTQPDPLITITSPTSGSSTLTIGSLADGTYQGELKVTITDTAQTPQEVEVFIPVTLLLAEFTSLVFAFDYDSGTGRQDLAISEDNLATLSLIELDDSTGDNWDNRHAFGWSHGGVNYIMSVSDETEGWLSRDGGGSFHRIRTFSSFGGGFTTAGGNNYVIHEATYGVEFDVPALARTDPNPDNPTIVDAIGNKTVSNGGTGPYPTISNEVKPDFWSSSIQGVNNGAGYTRFYNAADTGLGDFWTIEFSYKASLGDQGLSEDNIIVHSDKAWGTAGSWYISIGDQGNSFRFSFHDGVNGDRIIINPGTGDYADSPNGFRHYAISKIDSGDPLRSFLHFHAGYDESYVSTFTANLLGLSLDSNFRLFGDGIGSTAARTGETVRWADGNIADFRITDGYARNAGYQPGAGGISDLNRRYQQNPHPTGPTETVTFFTESAIAANGSTVNTFTDPDLYINGTWLWTVSDSTFPFNGYCNRGMTIFKGRAFVWTAYSEDGATTTDQITGAGTAKLDYWDLSTVFLPWYAAQVTRIELDTLNPAAWGGRNNYSGGQINSDGNTIFVGSNANMLVVSTASYADSQTAIHYSTDADTALTWTTSAAIINWAAQTAGTPPRTMHVLPDNRVVFISRNGVYVPDKPIDQSPTYTYTAWSALFGGDTSVSWGSSYTNGAFFVAGQSPFPTPAIFKSDDGGSTWNRFTPTDYPAMAGQSILYDIDAAPVRTGVRVDLHLSVQGIPTGEDAPRFIKTREDPNNFSPLSNESLPLFSTAFDMEGWGTSYDISTSTWFAGGSNQSRTIAKLVRSTSPDPGTDDWEDITSNLSSPVGYIKRVLARDGVVIVSGTSGLIQVSTDNGNSFTVPTLPDKQPSNLIEGLAWDAVTKYYYAYQNDSTYLIWESRDGGSTWSKFGSGATNPPVGGYAIAAHNGVVIAGSVNGELKRSTDWGDSWTTVRVFEDEGTPSDIGDIDTDGVGGWECVEKFGSGSAYSEDDGNPTWWDMYGWFPWPTWMTGVSYLQNRQWLIIYRQTDGTPLTLMGPIGSTSSNETISNNADSLRNNLESKVGAGNYPTE